MPTIFNCPSCSKETYQELPKCPHCGEVFMPDLVVEEPKEPFEETTGSKWLDAYVRKYPYFGPPGGSPEILGFGFLIFGVGCAIWQILFELGFLESGPFG